MLKTLSKILSNLYPISDFLYILQLEEYESLRYFKKLKRFFWKRNLQKRGSLIYTQRIKITLLFALPFILLTPPLTPFWIGVSNMILYPYFSVIRNNIQKKAANYFKKINKNTKVIAVAGSYGKTTTKNYIYEIIRYNYRTQMVPGNINTPTGIANWVLNNFDPETQILIVEVDSYFIGEIKMSLKITPPDISILTNIGDQHLERFKTRTNLTIALNEVFKYAKTNAIKIKNLKTNLSYALEVAKILKIPKDIIKSSIKNFKIPERRRNLTEIDGFEVIDDSYNISETTAVFGIKYASGLSKGKNKSLIVITAGIPELGTENKNGNLHLGNELNKYANKVFLLQSILANDVKKGISKKEKIIELNNMHEVWLKLKEFDPKRYLVLMQPELNDLYY